VLAVIALAMTTQGCALFQWRKYNDLKRKHDALSEELQSAKGELSTGQATVTTLRDSLKSKDHIVALYQEQKRKAEEAARLAKESVEATRSKLDEIAKRHGPDVEAAGDTLSIKSTLLFPLGKADVADKGKQLIADIAKEFEDTKDTIKVDGHTDDIPVRKAETLRLFKDNWGLSAARAAAVGRLLDNGGIAGDRITLRGFSKYHPIVPGAKDDEGRSKNRRVSIIFVTPKAPGEAPEPEPAP
jgi:chemotaxis protein MotB